jgi:pentatricopeptide repeat protein
MIHKYNVQPNGMTYSALIDVCSRCSRSDLALYGLRLMLRQKSQQQIQYNDSNNNNEQQQQQKQQQQQLTNEVGAWTAAINACGKAGRLDTAVKLFHSMSSTKFGTILPNTVTCGCLTDSLLRVGRVDDAVDILRYMKQHNIVPSEVMYTSLMSRAEKLVQMENKYYNNNSNNNNNNRNNKRSPMSKSNNNNNNDRTTVFSNTITKYRINDDDFDTSSTGGGGGKAIEVYTELIRSLSSTNSQRLTTSSATNTGSNRGNNYGRTNDYEKKQQQELMLKTFLVFQQMKDAGAQPDLACYNALLSACAKAYDLSHARYVLRTMQNDNIEPNDTTWRLLMRSATSSAPSVSSTTPLVSTTAEETIINVKPIPVAAQLHGPVETIWRYALGYRSVSTAATTGSSSSSKLWKPSIESFYTLLSSYLRLVDTTGSSKGGTTTRDNNSWRDNTLESWQDSDSSSSSTSLMLLKLRQHMKIVQLYMDVLMGRNSKMGMDRIDIDQMLQSSKLMMLVLQSILFLETISSSNDRNEHEVIDKSITKSTTTTTTSATNGYSRRDLRAMANSIALLECFQADRESILDTSSNSSSSLRSTSESSSKQNTGGNYSGGTSSNTKTRSSYQYQHQQQQQYQSTLEKALSFVHQTK